MEAERHHERGLEIVLIGHAGHPEVIGTMGQLPDGAVTPDRDRGGRARLHAARSARASPTSPRRRCRSTTPPRSSPCCRQRFPAIAGPHKEDICYATTNRQAAVKAIAAAGRALIVVGAPNSSNSLRLVEVAERAGCPKAMLVQRAAEIPWAEFDGHRARSASRPARRRPRCWSTRSSTPSATASTSRVENVVTAEERIAFNVPRELRDAAACRGRDTGTERAMAVYTEVADEELARFIASYGLGALLSCKGIAEGVENTNYLRRDRARAASS